MRDQQADRAHVGQIAAFGHAQSEGLGLGARRGDAKRADRCAGRDHCLGSFEQCRTQPDVAQHGEAIDAKRPRCGEEAAHCRGADQAGFLHGANCK